MDGLRALAVLQVLFFHADIGCPGGYAGVDVFFVISGFVITSLILREVEAGTFSMRQFWERRVRRIMPALAVMTVSVVVACWFYYLPLDFLQMGKSLLALAGMAANFYFWKDGDYYAPAAETKPLLHTWSLAVEEQFYLLFPLLLPFLIRRYPGKWKKVILGIALGSFAIGVAGAYSAHNYRAAFYLLPSRAWELMTGALVAIYGGRAAATQWKSEASGFLGLGLICTAMLCFDGNTRFPGLGALLPCVGTALVILSSGSRLSLVGRLLSLRPFVFIGLVSYPLYLWHWPLLSLAKAKYLSVYELGTATRLELLLLSLLLAVLSWKLIETPFRRRQWLAGQKAIFLFAGGTTVLFLSFGFVVVSFKGFPARFSPQVLAYAETREHIKTDPEFQRFQHQIGLEQVQAERFVELGSAPESQPISVLLWGDSHAKAVAPAVDQACRETAQRGVMAAYNVTPPVQNYISKNSSSLAGKAPQVAQGVLDFIKRKHIPKVILVGRWANYSESAEFRADLIVTVRALLDQGAQVIVMKHTPEHAFDVPSIAALTVMRGGDLSALGTSQEKHREDVAVMDETFAQVAKMGATVIDPTGYFLDGGRGIYRVVNNGKLLYFDNSHLALEGAYLLTPLFKSVLEKP